MVATIVLVNTTYVNQEIVNNAYYNQFEIEYGYITTEFKNAKNQYNIVFDAKTESTLKKWYTGSSINQVVALKRAFARDQKVTMDTIILEKIAIHNLIPGIRNRYPNNYYQNWHYAFPGEIYNQIRKFNVDDPEVKELFLLLKEQIDIFNSPPLDWEDYDKVSGYEKRKSSYRESQLPYSLGLQLYRVSRRLVADSIYSKYQSMLPEIYFRSDYPPPPLFDYPE